MQFELFGLEIVIRGGAHPTQRNSLFEWLGWVEAKERVDSIQMELVLHHHNHRRLDLALK